MEVDHLVLRGMPRSSSGVSSRWARISTSTPRGETPSAVQLAGVRCGRWSRSSFSSATRSTRCRGRNFHDPAGVVKATVRSVPRRASSSANQLQRQGLRRLPSWHHDMFHLSAAGSGQPQTAGPLPADSSDKRWCPDLQITPAGMQPPIRQGPSAIQPPARTLAQIT